MTTPHQSLFLERSHAATIRRAIASSPHNQSAVARLAGLMPQHLSNILAGERQIAPARLRTVCQALGLRMSLKLTLEIS